MLQENQIVLNIDEYLNQKYPNRIKEGDRDKYFTSAQEEFNNIKRGVALRLNPSALIIKMEGRIGWIFCIVFLPIV
jgi:hypothetical protein